MKKRYARIISIMLILCMIISAQNFAFAATADGFNRVLTSPAGGGFRIEDSESKELVKNATITFLDQDGKVMGKTVCADGENFKMVDIEKGKAANFVFSAENYKSRTYLAQNDNPNFGIGPNWYNKDSDINYAIKPGVVSLESEGVGIHTCKGTITVTESGTGAAIENAEFLLVDKANPSTIKYRRTLGADGSFIIENIIPASYAWIIAADGYVASTPSTSGIGGLSNLTDAKISTVNKSVSLVKATQGTAVITGKVTDTTGAAIAGASVQLKDGTSNIGTAATTTADGSYTINKVEAGSYTLEASAEGYDTASTEAFDVADGETIADKNISLEKAVRVTISGKVTDVDGQPIKGYVSVYVSQNGVNVGHGTVNEAGEFTLTPPKGDGKFAPGEYHISVHSKGYLDQEFDFTVPREEIYILDTIKLALDPIKDATITGYLLDAATGEPIAKGCSVSISKDGKMLRTSYANPGEEFKFDGLRAGTYVIEISASEYTGYEAAETQPIVLEDKTYEQKITNQNLYLQKLGEPKTMIGGFITADDQPADSNVKVNLLQDGQVMYDTECKANGNYVFGDIAPGTYTIEAQAEGYVSASIENVTVKEGKSLGSNNMAIYKKIVLERIEITKLPDKVLYEADEDTLDTTGMEVTAYYSDGTSKVLADDEYMLSGYGLTIGENIIVITYSEDGIDQETLLTVNVKEPEELGGSDGEDQDGIAGGEASDNSANGANSQDKDAASNSDNAAKTGDDMNIGALLALMALCGAAAAGTFLTRKRRETSK